jgi:hypothetical protein
MKREDVTHEFHAAAIEDASHAIDHGCPVGAVRQQLLVWLAGTAHAVSTPWGSWIVVRWQGGRTPVVLDATTVDDRPRQEAS